MNSKPRKSSAVRQHAAHRTLAVAVIALLLSVIPGSLLVDLCPPSARDPGIVSAIRRWQAHSTPPEVLVLGSSRSGRSIDAAFVTSLLAQSLGERGLRVFNGAQPAGEPLLMKHVGEQFIQAGGAPQIAVVEVSPDTTGRRNRLYKFTIERRFTLRDIALHFGDIVKSGPGATMALLASRALPFYRHRADLRAWAAQAFASARGIARPSELPLLEGLTWAQRPAPAYQERRRAEVIAETIRQIRRDMVPYETEGQTPRALKQLVAMFRSRGVHVILYQAPLHSAHRAAFSAEVKTKFNELIETLVLEDRCAYIDFSARLPDELLRDSEHATIDGRAVISRALADEVLTAALRERLNSASAAR